MSGPKKHPLEIFRSSGRKFGDAGHVTHPGDPPATSGPDGASNPPESPEPGRQDSGPPPRTPPFAPARREAALAEFELRLSLPGTAILLFVWLVLMGGSYIFGYHRGEDASNSRHDAQALENGKNLEDGAAPSGAASLGQVAAESGLPYGVPVGTYRTNQEALLEETRKTLTERYGVDVLNTYDYTSSGKVVLFAGVFPSKDDPQLKALEVKLRNIKDYPTGDKAPFRSVKIERHPVPPYVVPAGYSGPRDSGAREDSH